MFCLLKEGEFLPCPPPRGAGIRDEMGVAQVTEGLITWGLWVHKQTCSCHLHGATVTWELEYPSEGRAEAPSSHARPGPSPDQPGGFAARLQLQALCWLRTKCLSQTGPPGGCS